MLTMYVKDGDQVIKAPLRKPQDGEKAWIDIGPASPQSLPEVYAALGWDPEGLPTRPVSDGRAKLETWGNVSCLAVLTPEGDELQPFTIIFGPSIIITAHDRPIRILGDMAQDLTTKSGLLDSAHYLLYDLLERVSDDYLEKMDSYEGEFDELEESVLDGHDRARDVFRLRHHLHHVRGVLADLRRIAAKLSRRRFGQAEGQEDGANIFVDVYDAFYHVMDNVDSLRDNLTGLVDLGLNQRSTRLNEIMKFLTIFSTIFLPLTFITGFFGMNLTTMRPELATPHGQALTIVLMLAVAVAMLVIFKRRKWL